MRTGRHGAVDLNLRRCVADVQKDAEPNTFQGPFVAEHGARDLDVANRARYEGRSGPPHRV